MNSLKLKITTDIINFFASKNIRLEVDFSYDNGYKEPWTQITLYNFNGINNFAFFYDFEEDEINFSSIFEPLKPIREDKKVELKELFDEDHSIFSELHFSTEDNTIHIFGTIKDDEFDESFLNDVYYALLKQSEIIKALIKLDYPSGFNVNKYFELLEVLKNERHENISVSQIQRWIGVGYANAEKFYEMLKSQGYLK